MNYARRAPLVRSLQVVIRRAKTTRLELRSNRDRPRSNNGSREVARGSAIEISSIYVNYGLEVNIYKINCVPTHRRGIARGCGRSSGVTAFCDLVKLVRQIDSVWSVEPFSRVRWVGRQKFEQD